MKMIVEEEKMKRLNKNTPKNRRIHLLLLQQFENERRQVRERSNTQSRFFSHFLSFVHPHPTVPVATLFPSHPKALRFSLFVPPPVLLLFTKLFKLVFSVLPRPVKIDHLSIVEQH